MSDYKPAHELRRTLQAAFGQGNLRPYIGHPFTRLCARGWYVASWGTSAICYRCSEVIYCKRRGSLYALFEEHRQTCSFYHPGKKNIPETQKTGIVPRGIVRLLQHLRVEHKRKLLVYILRQISFHREIDTIKARAQIREWLQGTALQPAPVGSSDDRDLPSTPAIPDGRRPGQSSPPAHPRSDSTASVSVDREVTATSSGLALVLVSARAEGSHDEMTAVQTDSPRTPASANSSTSTAQDHSGATVARSNTAIDVNISSFEVPPREDEDILSEAGCRHGTAPDNDAHPTTQRHPLVLQGHISSSERTLTSPGHAAHVTERGPTRGWSMAASAAGVAALAEGDCSSCGSKTLHRAGTGSTHSGNQSQEVIRASTAEGATATPTLSFSQDGQQQEGGTENDVVSLRSMKMFSDKFNRKFESDSYKVRGEELRTTLGNVGTNLQPLHPGYSTPAQRLSTFQPWLSVPSQHASPQRLADHGFFYSGHHDQVTCYHCGTTIQHWDTWETLVGRHRGYSPNCRLSRNVE